MAKRILSLGILVAMIFTLVACRKPIPENIEIGFGGSYKNIYLYCGAKSDTRIFDVDNVKIDFYLGLEKNWSLEDRNQLGYEYIGVAAYFYGYGNSYWALGENGDGTFADYRNIENIYFIKEFSAEEFFSEQYTAEFIRKGRWPFAKSSTTFNYYETFTVPKEVLNKETYSFYFVIIAIWFSEESNHYVFGYWHDSIEFPYNYINDTQVRIWANKR